MVNGEGWREIYPRRDPNPQPVEVELVGGPRDGEVRKVSDIDAAIVFRAVLIPPTKPGERGTWDFTELPGAASDPGSKFVYRRRPDWPMSVGQSIPFDYMPAAVV